MRWQSTTVGHRLSLGVLLSVVVLLLCAGCRKDADDDAAGSSAAPKPRDLPTLTVKADTPNLLLTWVDEQGDFHVVQKPADVPVERRAQVRVVVADKVEGTGDLVYVANLNETAPDGTYRLKTMTRAAWDELGAKRRKARLEALAPPSASPPASAAPPGSARPGASAVSAIVYGADWCKPCHDAERYLKGRGVSVVKKDIEENEAAAAEMKRKLERAGMGGASIPVIDVMGRILVGFSPGALDRAVQAAQTAKPL